MKNKKRIKAYTFYGAVLGLVFLLTLFSYSCGSIGTDDSDDTDDGGSGTEEAPTSVHQWPMFHGLRNHTGLASVAGPQSGTLKWRFLATDSSEPDPDKRTPPGSVAVSSDGTIYVTGQGKIYALDSSGGKKWEKSYSRPQGPTLAEDGTIYLLSDDSLAALDASGNEQWTYSTGNDVIFGITLGKDGTLYQGSWDKYFYAVNSDGSLKWRYLTDGCVSYPATIDDEGFIYLGGGDAHCGEDKYLYSFTSDGTLRWRYDTGALRVGSPAVGPDGLLYVPASPTLLVVDKDGNLEWSLGETNNEVAGIITPAIAGDGTIYLGNSKGVISAVDPSSHKIKWTYQTGSDPTDSSKFGVLSFPVVDSKGTVYAGAVDGKMYAVDKDGNLKWSYSTGGHITEASPAVGSDGTLYFSSEDGYLYAIGN